MRRGNFTSIDEHKVRVEAFIDYINKTMARPFKWTYQGKTLAGKMRRNFRYDALVIVETIVRRFHFYGDIDFQKALPDRVNLFNKPEIHPVNSVFCLMKCRDEFSVFH